MKEIDKQLNKMGNHTGTIDSKKLPDSLLYPPEEDIYSKCQKVNDIDPDSISRKKNRHEISKLSGSKHKEPDLDSPEYYLDLSDVESEEDFENGADENSYYSSTSDNHNNPDN